MRRAGSCARTLGSGTRARPKPLSGGARSVPLVPQAAGHRRARRARSRQLSAGRPAVLSAVMDRSPPGT